MPYPPKCLCTVACKLALKCALTFVCMTWPNLVASPWVPPLLGSSSYDLQQRPLSLELSAVSSCLLQIVRRVCKCCCLVLWQLVSAASGTSFGSWRATGAEPGPYTASCQLDHIHTGCFDTHAINQDLPNLLTPVLSLARVISGPFLLQNWVSRRQVLDLACTPPAPPMPLHAASQSSQPAMHSSPDHLILRILSSSATHIYTCTRQRCNCWILPAGHQASCLAWAGGAWTDTQLAPLPCFSQAAKMSTLPTHFRYFKAANI